MTSYSDFLESKQLSAPAIGIEPGPLHPSLFDFQQSLVRWAIRRGRACLFAGCGMGKTRMQISWAQQMGRRSIIFAPLCVTTQTIEEAAKLGIEIRYATEQPAENTGIWISNYERLHKFNPALWDAVVLDESSILKSMDGKTRTQILESWTEVPYRLACSATPAPNDIAELANHAEFVGSMNRAEFLATWFTHDNDVSSHGGWRLKGHAQEEFWRWVATWAVYIRKPSDLGFDDQAFALPELRMHSVAVQSAYVPEGLLFNIGITGGIRGRHEARRRTIGQRMEEAIRLVQSNADQWLIWCGLNAEQDAISAALGDSCVSIQGSSTESERLQREVDWRSGKFQTLIGKPLQFGHGMNWQHCHQMAFLGIGDSYEQYYQAIRRCWRFGQIAPVDAWIITSDAEKDIVYNIQRKERDAADMEERIVAHVRDRSMDEVLCRQRKLNPYEPSIAMALPRFLCPSV